MMEFRPTLGLRSRLLILLLAVFGMLIALFVWHSRGHRDEQVRDASEHLLGEARLIAARQQSIVAHADTLLSGLMQRSELRPELRDEAACSQVLAKLMERAPEFTNIGRALPNGDVACSAVPLDGRVNVTDREWFRRALHSQGMVAGDVITGRIAGKPVLTFARTQLDGAGQPVGVLFIALDLGWLRGELAKTQLPDGARLGVLDGAGTVAVRYPDPIGWVGKSAAEQPLFKAIRASSGEGSIEEIGLDQLMRINSFTPLLETASGRMTLWLSVPKAQVEAPARRELISTLALALALLLLSLGLSYWGSEKLLLRPLLALSRTASRFGAGDHAARTGLPHGGDEIGRLAQTLDGAAEAIEASEGRLRRANRALRVLSAGNRTLLQARGEQTLIEDMCRAIVEAGAYRLAWVAYAQTDRDKKLRPMASWNADPDFFDDLCVAWDETAAGQYPAGTAVRRGIPVACAALDDPAYAPWRERALRYGYATVLALPLRVDGAVIGALNIYAVEPDAFAPEVVVLLSEAAADLSFGIGTQRARSEHERTRDELKRQEDWNRLILKSVGEGIFGLDHQGRCSFINPAGAAMLGWKVSEIVDQAMHERHHHTRSDGQPYPRDECPIHAAYRDGTVHRGDDELFWRKDGSSFPIEYVSTPIYSEAAELIGAVVSFNDISERKAREAALERALRALRTLSAGNGALIHASDEIELLRTVCRVVVEKGGYRMAWVGYADKRLEQTLTPKAWAGIEDGALDQLRLVFADADAGLCPHGLAMRSGQLQVAHEFGDDPGCAAWHELARKQGYVSAFAYPLKVSGQPMGVLGICAADANAFDADELALLTELGDDLAFGIETLRTRAERDRIAYEHVHHAEVLQKSLEQSIQAIADTVEARDPYTAGHQRRVGELAVAIATEMGLPEEKIHGIRLAAAIHDLGKIQIPAEYLSKPGRLTDIEFLIIKTHPQAGYEILKDVAFPWPIAEIVLQHHERLDGSGYPKGISDGQLLLESRIISVADVMEAMASHRPYRPSLGLDLALQEIRRGKGSAYDPVVVDACLNLFAQGQFAFQA